MRASSLSICVADGGRHGACEALSGAFERQLAQPCGRAPAVGEPLGGVAVADLGQGEGAARRHLAGTREERRIIRVQPCHRLWRLEIVLGVRANQPSGGSEGDAVADAGEDILKVAALRRVVQHLGGRDQGKAGALGMPAHARLLADLLGPAVPAHHRVEPVAERLAH